MRQEFKDFPVLSWFKPALLAALLLLSGCQGSQPAPLKAMYDLGPGISSGTSQTRAPSFQLAEIRAATALESGTMWYRLYDQPHQLRAFAYARWSTTPAELISLRLKQQTAQHGGQVLPRNPADRQLPLVQIELDEFAQHFSSPHQSMLVISGRILIQSPHAPAAVQAFAIQQVAGQDAASGAAAAQAATDELIQRIWQQLNLSSSAK